MQFVFWQNMISIHQSALIKALAREHGVLLAVQTDFEGERESSGWTVPDMGNARILISPDARTVKETLRAHPAAVHVFSGISTYPDGLRGVQAGRPPRPENRCTRNPTAARAGAACSGASSTAFSACGTGKKSRPAGDGAAGCGMLPPRRIPGGLRL